jgi:hypothetical protein
MGSKKMEKLTTRLLGPIGQPETTLRQQDQQMLFLHLPEGV